LQALFVARRTYPLAYNKWIHEQVADRLALPKLYEQLPPILSVRNIASPELGDKAAALRALLERWTSPEPHEDESAQPGASPNTGRAVAPGNLGATEGREGRPSVS
jgi:hypothetical protein